MKCKIYKCNHEVYKYDYCKQHFTNDRLYAHGLPFSKPLDRDILNLRNRIKGKKASMIIIDGGVGEGKTTLAVEVAECYQGKKLDVTKQYAMGGDQFQEKLVICYDAGLEVLIYDEAGDFNSRGALTSFNQMLNRVFDTFRAFKILVILVLPSFHVLDSPLFDKRIPRMLINCYNRNVRTGDFRVYSLYRMYYLRNKLKKYIVPAYAYTGTTPNYRGHFLDLSPLKSIELEKISIEGKKQIVSDNILRNRGLISYKEISKKLSRSLIWVKKTMAKLKVKEAYVYKRHKYFDREIVDKLKELV
jgi:hypothetical protein